MIDSPNKCPSCGSNDPNWMYCPLKHAHVEGRDECEPCDNPWHTAPATSPEPEMTRRANLAKEHGFVEAMTSPEPTLCKCGHSRQSHDDEQPYACLVYTVNAEDEEIMCECESFTYSENDASRVLEKMANERWGVNTGPTSPEPAGYPVEAMERCIGIDPPRKTYPFTPSPSYFVPDTNITPDSIPEPDKIERVLTKWGGVMEKLANGATSPERALMNFPGYYDPLKPPTAPGGEPAQENPVYKELRQIYCCKGAEFSRPTLEKGWKEIARLDTENADLHRQIAELKAPGGEPAWPECREFYELMQTYRHAPIEDIEEVSRSYEDVKQWLRSGEPAPKPWWVGDIRWLEKENADLRRQCEQWKRTLVEKEGIYTEQIDDLRRQLQEYDTRPFDKLPEDHAAHVEKWLTSNQKKPADVRWSLYPLGMVGRWIERAETAERKLQEARKALEKLAKGNRAPGVLEIAREALRVLVKNDEL